MIDKLRQEKKANLMFITSSLYLGGVQRVTYLLADALSEEYDVTVVYCMETEKRQPYSERCRLIKLPEYSRDAGIIAKLHCISRQVRELRNIKAELGTQVAVSLGNTANFLNIMSKNKERTICAERSNPQQFLGTVFLLMKVLFRRADRVVFQSEKIRSIFGRTVRSKSDILKNPLDIPEPAMEHRNKIIVALGRLTMQKNHALLIRSFASFHRIHPEYCLHIYGTGELREDLQAQIDALRLTESVILKGDQQDALRKIRDAEMFVLSSDWEGLPNSLLECMSMGIACISTRCEGVCDVIRSGENGILVDIGNEAQLTEVMILLAEDGDLRKKIEKQAMADMKSFDRKAVIKDWENVIISQLDAPNSHKEDTR